MGSDDRSSPGRSTPGRGLRRTAPNGAKRSRCRQKKCRRGPSPAALLARIAAFEASRARSSALCCRAGRGSATFVIARGGAGGGLVGCATRRWPRLASSSWSQTLSKSKTGFGVGRVDVCWGDDWTPTLPPPRQIARRATHEEFQSTRKISPAFALFAVVIVDVEHKLSSDPLTYFCRFTRRGVRCPQRITSPCFQAASRR